MTSFHAQIVPYLASGSPFKAASVLFDISHRSLSTSLVSGKMFAAHLTFVLVSPYTVLFCLSRYIYISVYR